MARSDRREHLIDTAISLFLCNGYHATGIDTILDKAGVSKKTLYHHFRSKDELILAALKKYDGIFRNNFMRTVEARSEQPYERLLAIFDVAGDWFSQNNFYGCLYINAIGEFSGPDTAIRQVCMEFKALLCRFIEDLCRELPVAEPLTLAQELALLLEGAIVTAQVSQGKNHSAKIAKAAATALIAQARTLSLPDADQAVGNSRSL